MSLDSFAEIRKAREEVEAALVAWNATDPQFEHAAWFAYLSAQERLNALIVEAKHEYNPAREAAPQNHLIVAS